MTEKSVLTVSHIEANFEMQLSGYYTGVMDGPQGVKYYFSELIQSLTWNHSVFCDPTIEEQKLFIVEEANKRDRIPAFFVREGDLDRILDIMGDEFNCARERWMICPSSSNIDIPSDLQIAFTTEVNPNDDFCEVLGSLFEDDAVNKKFLDFYIPTLKNAKNTPDTKVIHATAYVDDEVVSCGSIYLKDGLAGLYNIGTKASFQKHGYGRKISEALTKTAFNEGAKEVFLQCVINTHVEKLYTSIGYKVVETPAILTLK